MYYKMVFFIWRVNKSTMHLFCNFGLRALVLKIEEK